MKTGRSITSLSDPRAIGGTAVLLLVVAVGVGACADLTEPPSASSAAPVKPALEAVRPTAAPTPPPAPVPPPAEPAPAGESVTASHILVAFQGAMRADPTVTRTKEAAQQRASEILTRAQKGADFAKLADDNSDDPSAKRNHGSLGTFTRQQMVKPFADAAFALKPGQVSTLVETPFGFHVIKRTQ
jgi:NIMA-interacting peptidyl-prolyl cis-trans isomerase 1